MNPVQQDNAPYKKRPEIKHYSKHQAIDIIVVARLNKNAVGEIDVKKQQCVLKCPHYVESRKYTLKNGAARMRRVSLMDWPVKCPNAQITDVILTTYLYSWNSLLIYFYVSDSITCSRYGVPD